MIGANHGKYEVSRIYRAVIEVNFGLSFSTVETKYIMRTNYSRHFTTVCKRIVLALAIAIVAVFWIFGDNEYDSWWIIMPILIVVFIMMLAAPVEDLAITERELFYLRTSPLKTFSKARRFDIGRMQSIEFSCAKGMSDENKDETIIKMLFRDGSAENIKVGLLRKDVDLYVGRVKGIIESQRGI